MLDDDFNFLVSALESGPDYAAVHSGYAEDVADPELAALLGAYLAARADLFAKIEQLVKSSGFEHVVKTGGTDEFSADEVPDGLLEDF